jgi:acetate kinase
VTGRGAASERRVNLLVVNLGSSSVKLRVVAPNDEVVASADFGPEPEPHVVRSFIEHAPPVTAVGHRVVHGGSVFREATLVDAGVLAKLAEVSELAPLHNPPAIALLGQVKAELPDVPHVLCFDTAFHGTLAPAAWTYAVPGEWTDGLGLRRYGFHGLSHAWASGSARERVGDADGRARVVVCHLGAGASLAAVHGDRCVDTTMGFTPTEGLVMATRSGDVDPGALFWVQERLGWSPDRMTDALNHRSGLLGLSGRSGDMAEILGLVDQGDEGAMLARDVYVHRLRKGIASMAASAGGLDVLVFTGGVGEHAPEIRRDTCAGLGFLGVVLDDERNRALVGQDGEVGDPAAAVRIVVVVAREELEIARQMRKLLDL